MKVEPQCVVGIMGKAGAGKDTVAALIMSQIGYGKKYSFADALKHMCSEVFDIPMEWMYDQDLKKQEVIINLDNPHTIMMMEKWVEEHIADTPKWRWVLAKPELSGRGEGWRYQQVAQKLLDVFGGELNKLIDEGKLEKFQCTNDFGIPIGSHFLVSVRVMLQVMGTEVIRNTIDENFWAEIKEDVDENSVYVIPDCRFESELECVSSYADHVIVVVDNDDLDHSSTDGHSSEALVETVDEYLAEQGLTAIHVKNNLKGDYNTLVKQVTEKVLPNVKFKTEVRFNDNSYA